MIARLLRLPAMLAAVCTLPCGGPLMAQITTATFYGVVTDPSGAVVTAAAVTISNEETGVTSSKEVDDSGEFGFPFLPVGRYTIRIEAPGFKALENKGIELRSGVNIRHSFRLEVGQLTEAVTVTGEVPLLNAVSVEQRQETGLREIRELPLARRNIEGVTILNTGTISQPGRDLIFNGLGRGTGNFTIDGTEGSSLPTGPNLGGGLGLISLEAVEEVQTSRGTLPAEYARTISGNLNLITKSGTNQWHGTLFENWQGAVLNAREPMLPMVAPFTFNQFGGSGGGPIRRDKLFIFGVYEGYRESRYRVISGMAPTERLRRDMLARVPEYNLVLDGLPLPNQPHNPNAATAQYIAAAPSRGDENSIVLKPDYWLSSQNRISVTYTRGRPQSLVRQVNRLNGQVSLIEKDLINANYTRYGAAWNAETRVGYRWGRVGSLTELYNIMDPKNPRETIDGGRRIPGIKALDFGDTGEIHDSKNHVWSVEEKVAHPFGKHSLKFGGILYSRTFGDRNIQSPQLLFNTEQDLLNNAPNSVVITFGNPLWQGTAREFGLFVQDDWRLTPKLVVNLGIRYDYYSHFTVEGPNGGPPYMFNPDGIRDGNFTLGPFRPRDNPFESDGLNFGPRLGLAYNPDGRGKNVVRLGLAVLFAPVNGESYGSTVLMGLDYPFRSVFGQAEAQRLGLKFPVYNEDVLKLVQAGAAPTSFYVINPHIRAPYSYHLHLNVQRALTRSLMLETGFVGNRGVKFIMRRDYNQPDRATGIRPNPKLGAGQYFDNSESTHYASWQTSLRQRLTRGLTASAHYTWGKAITYGSGGVTNDNAWNQDFHDLRSNRGLPFQDTKHMFVADFVYETPRLKWLGSAWGGRIAQHVFGTWQASGIISARSGQPLRITQQNTIENSRPDATGDPPVLKDYRQTMQYLNPAAFVRIPLSRLSGATIRPGSLGKTAVPGLGRTATDLGMAKNFSITERLKVQFRADLFNAFNHVNLSAINRNPNSAIFGRITGTTAPRTAQLAMRLSF